MGVWECVFDTAAILQLFSKKYAFQAYFGKFGISLNCVVRMGEKHFCIFFFQFNALKNIYLCNEILRFYVVMAL